MSYMSEESNNTPIRSMSLLERFPPTELVIDDITGSDQFPDDLKIYFKHRSNYACLRRKWENSGLCHWLFWSDRDQSQLPVSDHLQTRIMEMIKSILTEVEGRGDFLVRFWDAKDIEQEPGVMQKMLTIDNQPFGLNSTNVEFYAHVSGLIAFAVTSEEERFEPRNRVFRNLLGCTPERRADSISPCDNEEFDEIMDEENQELLSRVFLNWRPECTPEPRVYLLRNNAVCSITTATLAFPLFEYWGCVGVMEIVTNSDRPTKLFRDIVSKYTRDPIYGKCIHWYEQTDNNEEALKEIKKSLEEVRRIHDIPLSRTWIPCRICDALFHIYQVIKTQDSSHHLHIFARGRKEKGRGAVGKAFLSNKLEFCEDVSGFSIAGYPLAHEVRDYQLTASFAVPLRRRSSSLNEEDDIYVVEFFLPQKYAKSGDWRTTVFSLLSTMRQHLKSVSIASGDEIGKDLSTDDIPEENGGEPVRVDSPNQGKENLPIDENLIGNGGETVRLDSPNQEKEENATGHAENNNKSCTEETKTTIMSSQQKVQRRKAGIPISFELLQQHFGMKLKDAAESIDVSRSTLKRACREYGIPWWPSRKRKNKENRSIPKKTSQCAAVEKQIGETSDAPIFNPSGKQHTETNISTELHEQDISSVTIKAKFGAEEFIRFKLPVTSGMREFQHQVEQRLHWKDGTYSVWCRDDDNDSILVKIDEDLQEYICSSRAMGRNTVTVSLQPITNFPNYPF